MNNLTLKKIDQTNFIDAFHLELQDGQERFVSHQLEALHKRMYTTHSVPHSVFILKTKWWGM